MTSRVSWAACSYQLPAAPSSHPPSREGEPEGKLCFYAGILTIKKKKEEASRCYGKTKLFYQLPPEKKAGKVDLGGCKCDHYLCLLTMGPSLIEIWTASVGPPGLLLCLKPLHMR